MCEVHLKKAQSMTRTTVLAYSPAKEQGRHAYAQRTDEFVHVLQFQPLVFDSVYTPLRTALIKEAESVGCVTVSGLEMFIRQAADQFTLFTGLEAPKDLIHDTVVSSLK
jgi:3-dehydroquinate dehydratase/shikimate dehydrogenase